MRSCATRNSSGCSRPWKRRCARPALATEEAEARPRSGYSPPDAAEAAGVGTTTIYIAVRNKELPAKKRGSRTIILATDLKRWLDALPSAHLSPEA